MSFDDSGLMKLRGQDWLDRQRVAGRCAAECLTQSRKLIQDGVKVSGTDLERLCSSIMEKHKCTPTFYQYKGFPGKICVSVNSYLVHGIPNTEVFQTGDVVKVDLGTTFEGAIADCAITIIKDSPKNPRHLQMLEACKLSLNKAIQNISIGKRFGIIGQTIARTAKEHNFGLVVQYGGHGISEKPHDFPFIPNKTSDREGLRFQPGMTFAIEPLFTLGPTSTWIGKDGWTVSTSGVNAHEEHTVYIHNDSVEIITKE